MPNNAPHNALRHHVSGAIARGEAEPITEQRPERTCSCCGGKYPASDAVPTFGFPGRFHCPECESFAI